MIFVKLCIHMPGRLGVCPLHIMAHTSAHSSMMIQVSKHRSLRPLLPVAEGNR